MKNIKEYGSEQTDDLQLITQVIRKMEQAHNQKDSRQLASLFAEDAVFVNAAGIRLFGRDSIYRSAKKAMESFMSKSFAQYQISGIKFLRTDIAIVDINQLPTTITGELLEAETAGMPTYILVKDGKAIWHIVAGQNTLVMKI